MEIKMQSQKAASIKSTIGIDFGTLEINNNSFVKVWDFAGQLEYTVTHQYFLSQKVSNIL
jgi:GTPase SAR1 family protein